jgi:hypothetical protein
MSTKINARSPFFLNYTEPVKPLVALTCTLIDATGFAVGVQGEITLPNISFGSFISITSSDNAFANGKWAVVTNVTTRSMTLRVLVPSGFSNADAYVDCTVTASQVVASCVNRITLNNAIPDKTLAVFGNSTTITLSNHFSISAGTLAYKFGQNSYAEFDLSLNSGVITITTKTTAGVFPIVVVAYSSTDSTTCEVVDSFNVTVNNAGAFTCTTANLLGGAISSAGVLTLPNSVGTITKTMETSGGSAVTSVAANGTGSSISKTLFYAITVPTGYSNAAASIECSVAYTQTSNVVVPTLACNLIDFDDQAILTSGVVLPGTLEDHNSFASGTLDLTDFNYTPKKFAQVSSNTDRDVTYSITVPSGYSNAGATLSCVYEILQPADVNFIDCNSRNEVFFIGVRIPLASNYLTDYSYATSNFRYFKVYADTTDVYNLQGKTLCVGSIDGTDKSPYIVGNGNITAIGRINYGQGGVSTVTVPEEFWITFGSGNVIQTLHRKNYANQTTVQIF